MYRDLDGGVQSAVRNRQYFLSSSRNASCLRTIDAVKKTSIGTYFSNPKAGTMLEVCTKRFGSKAKIDEVLTASSLQLGVASFKF